MTNYGKKLKFKDNSTKRVRIKIIGIGGGGIYCQRII